MIAIAVMGAVALPGAVCAADAEGLYETEVRVFSQSAAERQEALRTALAEVMVKVTGQRTAPAALGLAGAFKRVYQFVQQYRYRPLTESRLGLVPPPVPVPAPAQAVRKPGVPVPPQPLSKPAFPVTKEQVLWVSFDSAAVNKALRQAKLPLWGRARPATLAVLAVEEPPSRSILLADSGSELQALLETRAWWRGLPLVLPQRAEADGGIRFLEAWNNSQEPLLRAAAHERADAVLVGRMMRQGTALRVRWTLFQAAEEPVHWESAGDTVREVLEAGIDGAADTLGKRFAQLLSDTASNIAFITVTDIATLDNYAKVMGYLQSLDQVAEVWVSQVHASSVTFRVAARSNTESLGRAIALGKKLAPIIVPVVVEDPLAADTPLGATADETPARTVPAALSAPAAELKYQLLQ